MTTTAHRGRSTARASAGGTTGMVNSLSRDGVTPLMPSFFNATHDSANRITGFNGQSIAYDANGNPESLRGMGLAWNQKNQLVGVSGAPLGQISYVYDALSRRVAKIVNGVATQYLYDGLNIVAELDDNNNINAWYVMGLNLDQPLARIENSGAVHYYHADVLGSIVALTNSSGGVTTRYNYSPFGETAVIGTDPVGLAQPFRFTGREWDAETGMYYYRARYYAPEMGRFISEDPIRFESGEVNWYAYVGNNPVNMVDPLGLLVPIPIKTSGGFCGSGGNEMLVPDVVFFGYGRIIDFNPACKNHDRCYEDCNKLKLQCDVKLMFDMIKQCKFVGASCYSVASIYFGAVAMWGDEAYKNAQKKCKDKECLKK